MFNGLEHVSMSFDRGEGESIPEESSGTVPLKIKKEKEKEKKKSARDIVREVQQVQMMSFWYNLE